MVSQELLKPQSEKCKKSEKVEDVPALNSVLDVKFPSGVTSS